MKDAQGEKNLPQNCRRSYREQDQIERMGVWVMRRNGSRTQDNSTGRAKGAGCSIVSGHLSKVLTGAAALLLIPLLTACNTGATSVGSTDATQAETGSTESVGTSALPAHLENGESVVADGGKYFTDGVIKTGKTIDWDAVKKETPDAIAWLYVPDTDIDCAISKTESDTGAWMDSGNNDTFTDPQTIFHGSTKEGTALSGIMQYGDSQFFSDHPDLYVYTEDGQLMTFHVFASYEEQDQDLLLTYNCYDYDTFQDYINSIYDMRSMTVNLDTSVKDSVISNWQILTIQASEDGESGQDFLVQATLTATGTAETADGSQ